MSGNTERLNSALAGRYRIEKQLGQGGMATVYLAQDIKHDRKVAVKVLKPELAAVLGAERFVVEIKTTAALQHPHILPLFDSGTADGFLYYVMPYIEGETLRGKLNRETQFSVDEAVRITAQVADALDYAHRHGVIHRDIKPENILLHDGRPMVADFGIALAVSAAAGGRMTETGLSLGTPHYMSPEQATADKDITARSDIYSLASVLYEMLAGQPPHMGGSAQQIIMKIIAESAQPVTAMRKSVPPNVASAVAKALEKLPADRFESAKQFGEALLNRTYTSATHTGAPVSSLRAPVSSLSFAVAASIATITTVAALWGWLRPSAPQPVSRYAFELPEGARLATTNWSTLAVSPDGSKLVYMGESGRLMMRARDQVEPVALAGTEGGFNPFFSPDGQHLGFMAAAAGSAEVRTMSLSGGPPTIVTNEGVGGPGAGWGTDGYIYFDASGIGPLRRVRASGGPSEAASTLDTLSGELQHNWPSALPGGRGVLFVIDRAGPGINVSSTNDVAVLDLATKKHRVLVRGLYARYAKSGHLIYVTSTGVLMAAPFDAKRMELTGPAVSILEGVSIRRGGGGVDVAISDAGTLWYGRGSVTNDYEVMWATRSGAMTEVDAGWNGDFNSIALSPDAKRLALSIVDATGEQIWIKQLAPRGTLSKITFEGVNGVPRWSRDATRIAYVSRIARSRPLMALKADGTGTPVELVPAPGLEGRLYSGDWGADGWVVFEVFTAGTGRDIAATRPGIDTTRVMLANSRFAERLPTISPDGRWMAYESSTTGQVEVYVRPFPNASSAVYLISNGGGTRPRWSRDGSEIFYQNGQNELTRVAVTRGNTFAYSDTRVLFPLRGIGDWDVAPDGRFIVTRARAGGTRSKLVVVENFFSELNARAPR